MRRGFYIVVTLAVLMIGFSCNNKRSYTDMLKDQTKVIDRLIDENNFEILKDFPENKVFKENQFVKLSNGVYMNIVDTGNGNMATVGETNILLRARVSVFETDNDTVFTYDSFPRGDWLSEFKYGETTNYNQNDIIGYLVTSIGINTPLDYYGDSVVARLIIPFTVGSYYAQSGGYPVFVDKATYVFEK